MNTQWIFTGGSTFRFLPGGRKVRMQARELPPLRPPGPSPPLPEARLSVRGWSAAAPRLLCVLQVSPGLGRAGTDSGGTKSKPEAVRWAQVFRADFCSALGSLSCPHWEFVWRAEAGRKSAADEAGIGWDICEQISAFLQKFKSKRRWPFLRGREVAEAHGHRPAAQRAWVAQAPVHQAPPRLSSEQEGAWPPFLRPHFLPQIRQFW